MTPPERFRVINQPDGMMLITALVPAPSPPIQDFTVEGDEASKRYQKWIVLTAAGLLRRYIPGIVHFAEAFVDSLGPDSDSLPDQRNSQ